MIYRITFLGTGTSTGIPLIGCQCRVCRSENRKDKRLRASVLVEIIQENGQRVRILIDAGPDFRQQMLTYGIIGLDGILLTHEHRDHTAGLDDVRAFNFLSNKPVPIYAEKRVFDSLRKQFDYAFTDCKSPGLPEMTLHPIDNDPFYIRNVPIIPVRAMHGPLPIFGFRIGPIGYLTDARNIENKELEKFRDVEIFVVNTVQRMVHRTHFSLSQAIDVAQSIKAPESYLTHLSHCLEPHEELLAGLPPGIEPAYDGLIREVEVKDK